MKKYLKILSFIFLFLLIPFSMAIGDDSPLQKLDPILKAMIFSGKPPRLAPDQNAICPRDPNMISAIVRASGDPSFIESTGTRIRSVTGDIATADIPINALGELISMPSVIRIQSTRQMQPTLLDVSVPDTGADQVWSSTPGYTGKGVIVGVIDAGVDWKHPDFKGSDGTTRILYIWDQTDQTPRQYPTYEYGTEWTKDQIDSGQCRQMDATGHGTHIASTMAGNGGDRHEYTGIAPEAYIIAVKTTFLDADIIDAADYIFSKAEELNMPAVVNMSFGSHWGAHDGTDILDQSLDELLDRPGRLIVASAGNDADSSIHIESSSLRSPSNFNYPWAAIMPSVGAQSFGVQVWYPKEESLSVRLLIPQDEDGKLDGQGTGWISEGQLKMFSVIRGPLIGAEIIIDADQPASELDHPDFDGVFIRISNDGDITIPIDDYMYGIEFIGAGVKIDAYMLWRGRFISKLTGNTSTPNSAYLLPTSGSKTIISPSSANKIISVGSYATKSEWVDSQNRIRTGSYLTIGELSVFSSRGPLLNGGRKPEIVAPGEMIVAALSSDSWAQPKSIDRGGQHLSWRGTSMSGPHVAGTAALVYEKNPNLTALEMRNILTASASDMGPFGWDKGWGYGKLDVLAALGIPSTPQRLRATVGDEGVSVTWSRNPESDIAGYRLYAEYSLPDSVPQIRTFDIQHPDSSYAITDLPDGVPVILSMRAYKIDGNESQISQTVLVMPEDTPPPVPKDLKITPISTAADLTWSPINEYDLSGYRIYYGTSTGNYSKNIWAGKRTEYRIKDLANGNRIYAAITAVDTSGNESEKSKEVSGTPTLYTIQAHRIQSGWPVAVQHDVFSSPTLYDIDGNGTMEVAASAKNGKVYLVKPDGRNMPGWPISTGSTSVSSPAIGDMDGDGRAEIAVSAGEKIYLWHSNGSLVDGWPVNMYGNILSSPALGDIDGDGDMELVSGSRDEKIYAYNGDGSLVNGWPVMTFGPIHSSAAIGDIDGDSKMEVVFGSGDGEVYALNGDGSMVAGWPKYVGPAIHSSPALGDINGNGFPEVIAADINGGIHVWNYDGRILEGWPIDIRSSILSSPVLGDVDGDKKSLEIVICGRYGSVYVLKNDGTFLDGWPVAVMDTISASPALGDVDSDGKVDIIVATSTEQGYTGLIYAFKNTGKALSSAKWPINIDGNFQYSSPALDDIDGDGDIEIVAGSCRLGDGTGGYLYAWDLTGRYREENILWGGFRHDPQHTGVADDTIPPSFAISAIQNEALKKYINIYVVASEQLDSSPELTIEPDQIIMLTQLDTEPHIYHADFAPASSGSYVLTVNGTDINGNSGHSSKTISIQLQDIYSEPTEPAPSKNSLLANYPNPFNPGTWIPYELAQMSNITIDIYNISGQLVRSLNLGNRAPGSYKSIGTAAYWDGKSDSGQQSASGIYFYTLKADDFRVIRKMILAK